VRWWLDGLRGWQGRSRLRHSSDRGRGEEVPHQSYGDDTRCEQPGDLARAFLTLQVSLDRQDEEGTRRNECYVH